MEDTPMRSWTHCVVDQYVKEVADFSSQYGSDGSISYVANNVIGKPTLYPDYGDFSAAYCLVMWLLCCVVCRLNTQLHVWIYSIVHCIKRVIIIIFYFTVSKTAAPD